MSELARLLSTASYGRGAHHLVINQSRTTAGLPVQRPPFRKTLRSKHWKLRSLTSKLYFLKIEKLTKINP